MSSSSPGSDPEDPEGPRQVGAIPILEPALTERDRRLEHGSGAGLAAPPDAENADNFMKTPAPPPAPSPGASGGMLETPVVVPLSTSGVLDADPFKPIAEEQDDESECSVRGKSHRKSIFRYVSSEKWQLMARRAPGRARPPFLRPHPDSTSKTGLESRLSKLRRPEWFAQVQIHAGKVTEKAFFARAVFI